MTSISTNIDTSVPPPSKKVKKIITLYEDGTYLETNPHPWYPYTPWQQMETIHLNKKPFFTVMVNNSITVGPTNR
jgi:hypothetical protein